MRTAGLCLAHGSAMLDRVSHQRFASQSVDRLQLIDDAVDLASGKKSSAQLESSLDELSTAQRKNSQGKDKQIETCS